MTLMIGGAYAIATLSLNNSATIGIVGTIAATNGSLTLLSCTSTPSDYSTIGLSMNWGTVVTSGNILGYVCVINTGNSGVSLSATGQPISGYGIVSYSFGATTIAPGIPTLLTMTWNVVLGTPNSITWTTTITAI